MRNLVYLCEANSLPEVAAYWRAVLQMNDWQRERFTESIVRTLFNTVAGKKIAVRGRVARRGYGGGPARPPRAHRGAPPPRAPQVLGFAYKKDTSDIRESPARYVCARLLEEGAELAIYDPQVHRAAIEDALGGGAGAQDVVPDERPELPPSPGGARARNGAAALPRPAAKLSIETDAYLACAGAHALVVLTDWDEFKRLDYARIYGSMKRPCFAFDGRCVLDAPALRAIGFSVRAIGSAPPKHEPAPPQPPVSAEDLKAALNVSGPLDY